MKDYKKTIGITGRIGRKHYILMQIISLVVIVLFLLTIMIHSLDLRNILIAVLTFACLIIIIGIQVVMTIKRLHDTGLNPLLFLLLFVPTVNFIFGFFLCIKPGEIGENIYGQDLRNLSGE